MEISYAVFFSELTNLKSEISPESQAHILVPCSCCLVEKLKKKSETLEKEIRDPWKLRLSVHSKNLSQKRLGWLMLLINQAAPTEE